MEINKKEEEENREAFERRKTNHDFELGFAYEQLNKNKYKNADKRKTIGIEIRSFYMNTYKKYSTGV